MGRRVVVLVVTDPLGRLHRVRRTHRVDLAALVCQEGRWMLVATNDHGESYDRMRRYVLGAGADNWTVLHLWVPRPGEENHNGTE